MTKSDVRYAVHWVPVHGSRLADFGCEWTTWCADQGDRHTQKIVPGLDLPSLTRGLSRRGFHGVVCRGFRPTTAVWPIEKALDILAETSPEIRVSGLQLGIAGQKVALIPAGSRAQLAALSDRVMHAMMPFRADKPRLETDPPEWSAAAARAGLPWVGADKFHLALTDAMPIEKACNAAFQIRPFAADLVTRGIRIADLALVVDPGPGRPMRIEQRYPLSDRPAAVTDAFDCRGPRTLVTATVPLAFAEAV